MKPSPRAGDTGLAFVPFMVGQSFGTTYAYSVGSR
jgi:hypothetical protein